MREKIADLLFDLHKDTNNYICDGCGGRSAGKACEEIADHLIANDVVSVVRCKDCKHRMYSDFDGCYLCHHGGFNAINPDHFCSYGERKDNG